MPLYILKKRTCPNCTVSQLFAQYHNCEQIDHVKDKKIEI